MVPAAEAAQLQAELAQTQQLMEGSVPKGQLGAAQDEVCRECGC